MTGTTQNLINWTRLFIPDRKSHMKTIRNFEIGRTSTPTGHRDTFFINHTVVGSLFLHVEPYTYTAVASMKTVGTINKKYFMWNSAESKCTFSNGSLDKAHKPKKFVPVLADYEYTEKMAYGYSDDEIASFIPIAVGYLKNNFNVIYTYSGSLPSININVITDDDREVIAKATAILIRRSYIEEQKKRGLGISFRNSMQSLDTIAQLKHYTSETNALETQIVETVQLGNISGSGASIDLYVETLVTS